MAKRTTTPRVIYPFTPRVSICPVRDVRADADILGRGAGSVTDVRVSKGFLVGLGAVAAAALLALAFVLGRESGSSSAPPPATKIERVAPRKVDEPPPSSDPTATRVPETTERLLVPAQAPLPAQLGVSPGQPSAPVESRSNAGSDPERASVAAYFDAIERIQSGAVGGDPNGVATEMASALARVAGPSAAVLGAVRLEGVRQRRACHER